MKKQQLKYLMYATLLDAYGDFRNSDKIYSEYWGYNDNPPFSEEEFHEKQRLSLIDRINRVPMKWEDSEKADRGTAFNALIDCLIKGVKDESLNITTIGENNPHYQATFNNRTFAFPKQICKEFYEYFKGAISHVYTEAILPTQYGDVLLYGYIDELLPASVHDIKTTGSYQAGKFKNAWQKIVYPYCLNAEGNKVYDFEYNILLINSRASGDTYETFTEYYNYVPDTDIPRLTAHVEGLIEFIEAHRDLITDSKIFNRHEGN